MGITPKELRSILSKTNPPETPSGGFVVSHFTRRVELPKLTTRQLKAVANGRRLPKGTL